MHTFSRLLASTMFLIACSQLNSGKDSKKVEPLSADTNKATQSSGRDTSFFNRVYFSKSDAEKILGEEAYLSDSSSAVKKDTLEIKRAFTANSKDAKTDKLGVIYFMIEEYNQEASAKNAYNSIRVANEKHEGVKIVHDMGDEAYFHSDGQNFYFYLVRKSNRMFRIKVNKITSHTSLEEFNLVSKKISESL